METDVLRWFAEVADGSTVTEVADIYLVSQPGVSRALARLEQEVGAPLLQRSGRLLRLTEAGAQFKRHVDTVLHALDDGLAAVQEVLDPETGLVSVAFQPSLGTWLVPRLVGGFRRHHPRVQFRLTLSQDALGSALVAGGRVDLELTGRRPRNPAVHWERVMTQPLYLAVPPGHPLAARAGVALAEVAREDFVMVGPSWELRHLTEALCGAAGFRPRVTFEADDLTTLEGFVAAGLGVAVVPAAYDGHAEARPGGPVAVPLTDAGASRDIGLAWSNERRLLPAARLFQSFVLEELGAGGGAA